jgi:transcriptional regulator with XRE-family HTH domain
MEFGQRLKIAIQKQGISQQELAKAIGVSEKSVSLYINNKSMPALITLEKIAKTLNASADWLLGLSPTGDFELSFSKLTTDQRKLILALMKNVASMDTKNRQIGARKVDARPLEA